MYAKAQTPWKPTLVLRQGEIIYACPQLGDIQAFQGRLFVAVFYTEDESKRGNNLQWFPLERPLEPFCASVFAEIARRLEQQ